MLEGYGEEIFVDLLKHYSFNIAEFLSGGVASNPRLILTMIRHLPEGSNYVAALQSAPVVEIEQPTIDEPVEIDPVEENKMWVMDRLLMAQLINSVNMLVRYVPQWGEGQAPDLPIIGPAKWRGEGPEATPSKPESVDDTLNRIMGRKI